MIARCALGFVLALLAVSGVARGQAPAAEASPPAAAPAQEAAPAQAMPAQAAPDQAAPVETPAGVAAVAPTTAVLEKLASGDRAFAAGDLRSALFAYQDAVYAQPGYAAARVRLGRAYLAMRYPDFALAQADAVLRADPANPEALALLDEARRMPPRAVAPGAAPTAAAPAEPRPAPRAFKLTPEPAAPAAAPATAPAAAPAVSAPAAAASAVAAPVAAAAAAPMAVAAMPERTPEAAPAPAPTPAAPPPTAAQRYRTGVELIGSRDYQGAVNELSEAIALDPRLAVAYAARASARFGLGKYREAADDYKASLGLDPGLATPLYGLAECYRQLGDPAAVEMYQRYADSKSADVREDLRGVAAKRAAELSGK